MVGGVRLVSGVEVVAGSDAGWRWIVAGSFFGRYGVVRVGLVGVREAQFCWGGR